MKYLIEILRFPYTLWVVLLFFLTMLMGYFLLVILGKLVPKSRKDLYSNFILRYWSLIWSTLIGIFHVTHGRSKEFAKRTQVIVTNHNSYLDTVTCYINLRGRFKTLAKRELIKAPVMGPIFNSSGILVDRSNKESRAKSYERMQKAMREGLSILIFPEGTQNRTPEPMQNFYDGAFRLAIDLQVPVQPVVTTNTRRLMPQAKIWKIRPGVIHQYFLDPVQTTGMTQEDLPALRDNVRELILEQFLELDPGWRKGR